MRSESKHKTYSCKNINTKEDSNEGKERIKIYDIQKTNKKTDKTKCLPFSNYFKCKCIRLIIQKI